MNVTISFNLEELQVEIFVDINKILKKGLMTFRCFNQPLFEWLSFILVLDEVGYPTLYGGALDKTLSGQFITKIGQAIKILQIKCYGYYLTLEITLHLTVYLSYISNPEDKLNFNHVRGNTLKVIGQYFNCLN